MRRLGYTVGVCAVAMGMFCLAVPVQAEMYVAGQVGASVPNKFSNIEGVDNNAGLTISDLSLQNSLMYGAKFGYYFDSIKWLGVETEVFNSTPHVKQQDATVSFGGASATGNLSGQSVRVLNWAPINIVVRHQMGGFPSVPISVGHFASLQLE